MASTGRTAAERIRDNADIAEYRRSARWIHALEESEATYQSREMRLRSAAHNRTFFSSLINVDTKSPLVAKIIRGTITAGLAYAALKWMGDANFATMKAALGYLGLPEGLSTQENSGALPLVGAVLAARNSYIEKILFEPNTQLRRLIDKFSVQRQLSKINNVNWYESLVSRLTDDPRPFSNFDDLRKYCTEVVKEVHPAKQTEAMAKAVESTHQLDFWAIDLALRIHKAASNTAMTLQQATAIALNTAPWATKTLKELQIVHKTDEDPTAYGLTEFKRGYTTKDEFSASISPKDLGLIEAETPQGGAIKQRIDGLSARFESKMNRSEVMTNLLSGSGAAAAVTLTAVGGLSMFILGAPEGTTAKAAATFISNYMALAPQVLTGALTVQAPLRVMQMIDTISLAYHKTVNAFDHKILSFKNENWNEQKGQSKLSLAHLRASTARALDRWNELQGLRQVQHTTDKTAVVARDLTVEKLLHEALQYKLQQPRLDMETLIRGLVHERGFQRDTPLQSLERPKAGAMPVPLRSTSKERVQEFVSGRKDEPAPTKNSQSAPSL